LLLHRMGWQLQRHIKSINYLERAVSNSLHILLVEDDPDSLAALARLLECTGYRICRAATVKEALAAAAQTRFDLVISDISLPDGSGLDLMRELRQSQSLPGIAMTGHDSHEESRVAGFSAHLTKPIDFAELVQLVAQVTANLGLARIAS